MKRTDKSTRIKYLFFIAASATISFYAGIWLIWTVGLMTNKSYMATQDVLGYPGHRVEWMLLAIFLIIISSLGLFSVFANSKKLLEHKRTDGRPQK